MSVELKKRKISWEAYHVMIDAGIFGPEDKIELLNGEIIDMSPIGNPHVRAVAWLNYFLNRNLPEHAFVLVQSPIQLSNFSEPEPDITICKFKDSFYGNERAQVEDIYVLIEVSDTTLEKDRQIKLPLYAEAGIPIYCIVNLPEQKLEVYSKPQAESYDYIQEYKAGELALFESLNIELPVAELFG